MPILFTWRCRRKWQQVISSRSAQLRIRLQARLRHRCSAGVAGDSSRRLRVGVLPIMFHQRRMTHGDAAVLCGAHVHEPGVRAHVEMRTDRVPAVTVREVMAADLHRIRPAAIPARPARTGRLFLLLGVTLITGCRQQVLSGLRGDVRNCACGPGAASPPSPGPLTAWKTTAVQQPPAVCELHRCPCAVSAPARCCTLFVVHVSGDRGSPGWNPPPRTAEPAQVWGDRGAREIGGAEETGGARRRSTPSGVGGSGWLSWSG